MKINPIKRIVREIARWNISGSHYWLMSDNTVWSGTLAPVTCWGNYDTVIKQLRAGDLRSNWIEEE
jgi:hypothetical protein